MLRPEPASVADSRPTPGRGRPVALHVGAREGNGRKADGFHLSAGNSSGSCPKAKSGRSAPGVHLDRPAPPAAHGAEAGKGSETSTPKGKGRAASRESGKRDCRRVPERRERGGVNFGPYRQRLAAILPVPRVRPDSRFSPIHAKVTPISQPCEAETGKRRAGATPGGSRRDAPGPSPDGGAPSGLRPAPEEHA